MKLSVIIPAYNVEKTVVRCIQSIITAGRGMSMEIIVVNDGSTDSTSEIVSKLAEQHERIRYVTQSNKGLSGARNAGLNIAQGEYILLIDSDDCISPDYFDDFVDADLIVTPHDAVFIDSGKIVSNMYECTGFLTDAEQIGKAIGGIPTYAGGKFFRRSIIEDHHIRFDESLHFGEDNLFVLQYYLYVNSCYIRNTSPYLYTRSKGATLSKKYVENLEHFYFTSMDLRKKLYVRFPSYKKIYQARYPDENLRFLRMNLRNIYRENTPYRSFSSKHAVVKQIFSSLYVRPESMGYMVNSKLDLIMNILFITKSTLLSTAVLNVILH